MKRITKINADKPKQIKRLRVAAYCRVSTDSDAQLESLEAQKAHYESYISGRDDWELVEIYYDRGITGTKKEKRPELLRMIADCEKGKIDFIVTKSISRFARNTTDCLEVVRKLLDLNIPIFFEKENLNTGSMESELFLAILSSMAEGESTSISQNVKWSIQQRFRNGTFKICYPPYGYDWNDNRLVINPEQAEVVKWIFAQVLSGKGTQKIADELNQKDVPTKKGGHWSAATIRGMLTNEKYIGDAVFQKTYTDTQFNRHINNGQKDKYVISDHHEAIISREDFEAARALIEQRCKEKGIVKGSEKYQHRYSFSSKIICGKCGNTFKRRKHTCSEYKYVAWCCNTHLNDKTRCSMKYIRDDELKAAFVTMINKLVFAHRIILIPYVDALKNDSKDDSLKRIQEIQTLLLENAEQRDTLTSLMAQGYIEQAIYNEENQSLLSKETDYHTEIALLNRRLCGDTSHITAAQNLLCFAKRNVMLDTFDDTLFKNTVTRVQVISRREVVFELKCGLKLKERI